MANKLYRAIGRVLGLGAPLEHGDTIELDHEHVHTVAAVAAGGLKLASAEKTEDEHAGDPGYSTAGAGKGGTLADAVIDQGKKNKPVPKAKAKAKAVKGKK